MKEEKLTFGLHEADRFETAHTLVIEEQLHNATKHKIS